MILQTRDSEGDRQLELLWTNECDSTNTSYTILVFPTYTAHSEMANCQNEPETVARKSGKIRGFGGFDGEISDFSRFF